MHRRKKAKQVFRCSQNRENINAERNMQPGPKKRFTTPPERDNPNIKEAAGDQGPSLL